MVNGVLLLDKPEGFTSHDAVAKLRGILHQKRIGHAGTLDPMATGLLVMLLGSATRASDYAGGQSKRYLARLRLGLTTDTQDITGQVLDRRPAVAREALEAILPRFTGDILQVPPMYSAVQVGGRRLYDLARQGKEVARPPRPVTIHSLALLPEREGLLPEEYLLEVCCSKGTYVRTLAHDMGQALGCGACLSGLRRIHSGFFDIGQALTLSQAEQAAREGGLARHILPVDQVYAGLPAVTLLPEGDLRVRHGAFLLPAHLNTGQLPPEEGLCRVYDSKGRFCQIGRGGRLDRGGPAIFCQTNFMEVDS